MKIVEYTQVWGMLEYMEDQEDRIGAAFADAEPIAWLFEQGYMGVVTRHHQIVSDNFHIKLTFYLPDEVYTFLMLRWPEEIIKIDFDGPTLTEERNNNAP